MTDVVAETETDATDLSAAIGIDQVGQQDIGLELTGVDFTGWTWQCQVWTALGKDGGRWVCDVDVVAVDATTGSGTLVITAEDAERIETGMLIELVQLTPTKFPWMRAELIVNDRVADDG